MINPTFYDHNEDGLLDLFVGNYGYHLPNGTPISKIDIIKIQEQYKIQNSH